MWICKYDVEFIYTVCIKKLEVEVSKKKEEEDCGL